MRIDIFSTFLLSHWSFLNHLLLGNRPSPRLRQEAVIPPASLLVFFSQKEFNRASFRKTLRVIHVVFGKAPVDAVLFRREQNRPILNVSFPPRRGHPSSGVLLHRRGQFPSIDQENNLSFHPRSVIQFSSGDSGRKEGGGERCMTSAGGRQDRRVLDRSVLSLG